MHLVCQHLRLYELEQIASNNDMESYSYMY
jgi:hypothetical protein